MTSCKEVVDSYETMRDAVGHLADSTSDIDMKDELGQRAFHAGTLADRCRTRFGDGEVPDGAHAVQDADHATSLAKAASPTSRRDMERTDAAAQRANRTLNGIIEGRRSSNFDTKFDIPLIDLEDATAAGGENEAASRRSDPSPLVLALAVAVGVALIALPLVLLRTGAKGSRKRRRG